MNPFWKRFIAVSLAIALLAGVTVMAEDTTTSKDIQDLQDQLEHAQNKN